MWIRVKCEAFESVKILGMIVHSGSMFLSRLGGVLGLENCMGGTLLWISEGTEAEKDIPCMYRSIVSTKIVMSVPASRDAPCSETNL